MECCKDISVDIGATGNQGETGDKGATGAAGVVGDKGPNGTNGLDAPELKGFSGIRVPLDAVALAMPKTANYHLSDGVSITTYRQIYDDWDLGANQFNPTTGIWTCPATDKYDINAVCNLKTSSEIAKWGNGYVFIGILNATTNEVYCGRAMITNTDILVVNMSCTLQGRIIPANTQLIVKFLNRSNYDYVAVSGDIILFEARKCK